MKEKYEADFDQRHDAWCDGKVDAPERRFLMTKWLKEAWTEFFAAGGQEQVTKAFKRCGMLNAIDGSEDSEIHVQGVENYDIGESSDEESEEESSSDEESESESEQSDIESESEDEESESDGDEGNDSEKSDASEENAVEQKKKRNQKKPLRRATKKVAKKGKK